MALTVGNNNSGMPYIPPSDETTNPATQEISKATQNEQVVQGKSSSSLPSPFAMMASNDTSSFNEVLLTEEELRGKVLADPEIQQELKDIDNNPNYTATEKEFLKEMLIANKVMELNDIQVEELISSTKDMTNIAKNASRDMT